MKKQKETFFDRLTNRLPEHEARKAIKALHHARNHLGIDHQSIRIFSDLTKRHRTMARVACNGVREWSEREAVFKIEAAYRKREYELLRRQALDAISLYQDAKQDYIDLKALDLERHPDDWEEYFHADLPKVAK